MKISKLSELVEKLLELSTDPRKHYQLNRFVFAYKNSVEQINECMTSIRTKSVSIYFENEFVYSFDDMNIDVELLLFNMGIRGENLKVVLKEANFINITRS